ncbi:MAG: hypothetical protein H6R17_3398 [Proteobacteria bacterium]|nr:hypothetical protein [Pseudomonadota bacterium]
MIARAKTYYGVSIGILMVNARFRRFPGDIGNAQTWPFPVQYRVVEEATPDRVTMIHQTGLLEHFKRAALELVDGGVDGIASTCGFLSLYQQELADFLPVPVATSSLLQVPLATRLISGKQRVGIITFLEGGLKAPYLEAVGIDPGTPVAGLPADSEFVRSIRESDNTVPYAVLRDEVLATAKRFHQQYPDLGALVLECTNLSPFAADIHELLGLPVFDTVSLLNWFHGGLRPRRF